MHLVFVLNVARRWQIATAAGDERRARAFGETLEEIARQGTVFASAGSEPRQDLIRNDWDALGMRASGSHSVSFEDVRLPLSALRGGFPIRDAVEYMERNLAAGLFHAVAALGIAESAQASVAAALARRDELDAHAQMLVAESLVDLSASRAVFSRAAALIDEHHERNPGSRGTAQELTRLFAEAQSAKLFTGETAVRIVDHALALSGGAGYLNGSPLARGYRDVRALPFMHPLGANRAYTFLGQLAAGREPNLH